MINVAAEEVKRAVDQYYSQNGNTKALDGFFGGEKWKTDLVNIASDKEIYDYYAQKIVEEAGKKKA